MFFSVYVYVGRYRDTQELLETYGKKLSSSVPLGKETGREDRVEEKHLTEFYTISMFENENKKIPASHPWARSYNMHKY
jgi:hypothetical protein